MSFIQSVNNNIITPTIDYIYANPDIAIDRIILAGSIMIHSPTAIVFAGLTLARQYFNPYIEHYTAEYPYITTTLATATAGIALYFDGANILYQNLYNTFTSKITLSLLSVIGITFAVSYYYLALENISHTYIQCLDNSVAVEIVTDLTFQKSAVMHAAVLGYYLSCVERTISRDYFLTNETNSHSKILSVTLISGTIGGSLKYGSIAAVTPKSSLVKTFKMSIMGAFKHATYATITAYTQKGIIPSIIGNLSPFIAESLDIVTGFLLSLNSLSTSNFKQAFELEVVMYGSTKFFLPIAEKITLNLANILSPQKTEHQITDNTKEEICLVGKNDSFTEYT